MEELCMICNESLADSEITTVRRKGMETIKKSSLLREDGLDLKIAGLEQFVLHRSCRQKYINEKMVSAYVKRKIRNAQTSVIFNQDAEEDNVNKVPEQDPLQSDSDASVIIKQEIEDDISEHEDDLRVKLENKRQQEESAFEANKKIKVEETEAVHSVQTEFQPHTSQVTERLASKPAKTGKKQPALELEPNEVFMSKVLSSQNEILSILKHQVLLQEPNPELLTFLRFLGMKMSRLSKEKRKELQDRITEMVLKEC